MDENAIIGACPKCGSPLLDTGKVYSCSTNRSRKCDDGTFEFVAGCGFKITPVGGKLISQEQAKKLITAGKTDLQKFVGKWSGRPYEAYLILNAEKVPRIFFPPKAAAKPRDLKRLQTQSRKK